jgi:preprotein translocase subunit SecE
MENKALGRFVSLGYIFSALLVAFVLSRGLHWAFFAAGVDDMAVLGKDFPLSSLLGVVIAAVAGIVSFRHPVVRTFADEVALELSKVTWPTRQETWAATIVVIVTVAISAVYLGVFDMVWSWASNALLQINGVSGNG